MTDIKWMVNELTGGIVAIGWPGGDRYWNKNTDEKGVLSNQKNFLPQFWKQYTDDPRKAGVLKLVNFKSDELIESKPKTENKKLTEGEELFRFFASRKSY